MVLLPEYDTIKQGGGWNIHKYLIAVLLETAQEQVRRKRKDHTLGLVKFLKSGVVLRLTVDVVK